MKELWLAAMPPEGDTPPDSTFIAWIASHQPGDIEYAIAKAGKKMCRNIHLGAPLIENAAAKYCSSVRHLKQEKRAF
jgi:hypothetical protein